MSGLMVCPHQSVQGQGLENQATGREDGFHKATSMVDHQPKTDLPKQTPRILEDLDDAPQPSHSNEKKPGTIRILEYLEDATPSSDDIDPNGAGESDQSRTTMRGSRQRSQAPAGAYSGSVNEGYRRLEKVDNCGQVLAVGEIPISNDDPKDVDGRVQVEETKWWQQKWCFLAFSIAFLLVVLSIAIPVAALQSKSSEEYPVEEESVLRGTRPQDEKDYTLVPNITNATIQAIEEDVFSPQARAFELISKDADWDSYDDWRKQQRFAMACYMYAFAGGWSQTRSYADHECQWATFFKACRGSNRYKVNFLGKSLLGVDHLGSVPAEIAFLSDLEGIEITGSSIPNLEEALPLRIISSMPHFKELTLQDCELAGSIPSTLGLLSSLSLLDLSKNRLTGIVPEEIGELPLLQAFNIKGNPSLEGPLPSGFCSENRTEWVSLQSDWCQGSDECCTT